MAYIALQDLLDKLGEDELVQLTDNAGIGEVDATVVDEAIQYAQGVFDSYARTRYTLPVPPTPLVRSLNIKIAVFSLFENRATIDEGVYKIRKNAYDDAVKQLIAISQGKAALDVPAIAETIETPMTGDKILTNAGRAKFNDNVLKGF